MRKVEIEIEFTRAYMQHRRPSDKKTIDGLKLVTKTLQRDPDNEEAYKKEAELSLYRNEQGKIVIPSIHVEGALIKGGTQVRMAGKGKKTYKDTMKAFVEVSETEIPIDNQDYELDRRWVVVQRNRILRTRPIISKGTKAIFILNVFDDALSLDILKEILTYAGMYVGIGDYRPKFGLFQVNKFEPVKEK